MRLTPSNIEQVKVACMVIAKAMQARAFQSRFPNAQLLRSSEEIEAARQSLPSDFVPFMIERQPTSTDLYAFESCDDIGGKVVVWNDHAIVGEWSTFEEFMKWLSGDSAAA